MHVGRFCSICTLTISANLHFAANRVLSGQAFQETLVQNKQTQGRVYVHMVERTTPVWLEEEVEDVRTIRLVVIISVKHPGYKMRTEPTSILLVSFH